MIYCTFNSYIDADGQNQDTKSDSISVNYFNILFDISLFLILQYNLHIFFLINRHMIHLFKKWVREEMV